MKKVIYPKIGGVDSIEIIEAEEPRATKGEVVCQNSQSGNKFCRFDDEARTIRIKS